MTTAIAFAHALIYSYIAVLAAWNHCVVPVRLAAGIREPVNVDCQVSMVSLSSKLL